MTKANYLYCYALFDRLKKWSYHIYVTVAEMRVQCTPNTIKITPKFGCSKTTHWKTKLDHQLCKVQTSLALQQISYTHVINNIQLILPVIKINWKWTCEYLPEMTDSESTSMWSSCTLSTRQSNLDLRDRTFDVDDINCRGVFCQISYGICIRRSRTGLRAYSCKHLSLHVPTNKAKHNNFWSKRQVCKLRFNSNLVNSIVSQLHCVPKK